MNSPSAPLGVFDSGLGGLTVVHALRRRLPAESIVYLGDTARVPYGTRSAQTVVRYALNNARTLVRRADVKLLVVACNTVSAVALEALREDLAIPVVGVIEPGARAAQAGSLAISSRPISARTPASFQRSSSNCFSPNAPSMRDTAARNGKL